LSEREAGRVPEVRWGPDGLAPAIVQDPADGRVLMLAWMDEAALEATAESGMAHFYSRSRGRLWRKGETSGNVLRVLDLALDCDADAILLTAEPAGPTCHRGTRSCFDPVGSPSARGSQGFVWLEELWSTIASRAAERPEGSYTARLIEGGVDAVGRKVTEEATEVLLAAKNDDPDALAAETADLLYHTLVLLAERRVTPSDVLAVLRSRRK